jgi:hypothetical protein
MELVQIRQVSSPEDMGFPADSPAGMNIKMQVEYYSKIGFHPPWIGYLAVAEGIPVGLGAFKGPPVDNRVEIAYFTFPENEGKGIGTEICRTLVSTALAEDPRVEVTARTLPEKNASNRILSKNGFVFSSTVQDPEDGEVWEWKFVPYLPGGPMHEVHHVSVSIARPPAEVYAFASDPRNLPRWAAGLARSEVARDGDAWVAEAPFGKVRVKFAPPNPFHVMDHDVTLESGITVHNPMRVVPNGAGSEFMFTLVRQPGMTDAEFARDKAAVEQDLKTLKTLLEPKPSPESRP